MRHRKKYHQNKEIIKQIAWIVVGAVIFMAIYSLWTNPSLITEFKESMQSSLKLFSSNSEQDPLIRKCMESFDQCKNIGENKYEMNIKLQDQSKFQNISEAEIFFKMWSDVRQGMGIKWYISQQDLPIVLFATKINIKDDDQESTYPYVVFCNSKGQIIDKTKSGLGC